MMAMLAMELHRVLCAAKKKAGNVCKGGHFILAGPDVQFNIFVLILRMELYNVL